MSVSAPTITDSVDQNFFIEALNGALPPVSYLDSFPDSVYTKALDSLLVKFLYTLMGPAGAGSLRKQYLEARLQIEQAGLKTTNLDSLYSSAFGLARLAEETYQLDADSSLLPAADRVQVLLSDASFRSRAIDFLKGARGGSTVRGLTLVARSGLGYPVELIENYKSLFDHYSDAPLGLPNLGTTNSVSEVVVIPHQALPQNARQILSFTGLPAKGWFSLTYPAGQAWMAIPVSTVAGSNTITVPSAANLPVGVFVTLTNLPTTSTSVQIDPTQAGWNHATLYAQSNGGSGTSVSLIQPLSGSSPGSAANAPTTGNFIALVGVGQTTPIPYNATSDIVQQALNALPLVGQGNIVVSGGPLPSHPLTIDFVRGLGDQTVPGIIPNVSPDAAVGITSASSGGTQQLADILNSPLKIVGEIEQTTGSSYGHSTTISDADLHSLYAALDQTKPMTSLFTTQPGVSAAVQQQPSATFTESTQANVLRYVTGRAIQWPAVDGTHWIEAGVEHEAPTSGSRPQYQGFHNISNIVSYTESALNNSNYSGLDLTTLGNTYWNSLIGGYSQQQLLLYPGLSSLNPNNYNNQYLAIDAQTPQPEEPLVISSLNGISIINGIYPADYLSLPGVPQPKGGLLWASSERPDGIDYLEIDLGVAQAVNYLYFEATNKPYLIDVSYDTLDQSPSRSFIPVTLASDSTSGSSTASLHYQSTQLWSTVNLHFSNSLGGMIYTRFLRVGFTKSPVGTPYGPVGINPIPYSIEVRNLRVGRNVS